MKTQYTVNKIKNNEEMYKTSHGSVDGNKTLCGVELDHHYFITDNEFKGIITCKKCLKNLLGG